MIEIVAGVFAGIWVLSAIWIICLAVAGGSSGMREVAWRLWISSAVLYLMCLSPLFG